MESRGEMKKKNKTLRGTGGHRRASKGSVHTPGVLGEQMREKPEAIIAAHGDQFEASV